MAVTSAKKNASEAMNKEVGLILQKFGTSSSAVIPILQAIQKEYNYLPEEVLTYLAENSEITPAEIISVASFYSQFRMAPVFPQQIIAHILHSIK